MATFMVTTYFIYDVLFSPPSIHKGIIVEKLFVPGKNVAAPNIIGSRYRSYKYAITAKNHHQWIAIVKDEAGQELKVNCKSDHYENKQVGDTLLFKEFRGGELFKVEYFSHNDEDIDILDLKKNHVH
jgi:hypothetical protein